MNFFVKAVIVIVAAVALGFVTFALVQPLGNRGPEPVAAFASIGVSLLSLAFLAGLFFLSPPAVNPILCPGLLASGTLVIMATLPAHTEPAGLRALAFLAGVMLLAVGVWAGVAPGTGNPPLPPVSQT
jgi:hypothetical protein